MISFDKSTLHVNGVTHDLPYEIDEVFECKGNIIVLFKPNAKQDKTTNFPNLVCYSKVGNMVWTASLPTNERMDRYYKISSHNPLIVHSVCSFTCEIDCRTGNIIKKTFYK